MAKGRLTEDEIKWILSVESTEAQQQIHKLTKANKDLMEANKRRLKEMINLEKQGKKESKEYQELDAIIKQNTKTISKNKDIITQLESRMKTTDLTMSQLRKRARDLQQQLDNTAKGTHPEQYQALEKQLKDVQGRMTELRGSSKNVGTGLTNLKNIAAKAGIAAIGYGIYKSFSAAINKIKELTFEGVKLATEADGILHAFDKLNRPDILEDLREATNYTIEDLQLMKATLMANDLNVAFKDLPNILALAELQAEKTGESLEELMKQAIEGMAKQRSASFIRLGISKSEIETAKKETGSFMSAINKIIEDRLAEQSDDYVSAGDKEEQALARVKNAQIELGKELLPLKEKWDTLWASIQIGALKGVNSLSKLIGINKDTTKTLGDSVQQYAAIQVELPTLAKKYDTLKNKVNLTKDEHRELNTTINRIATLVPSAVTSWDQYGNAISISTDKVYEFLEAEKARLKFMNKEAIQSTKQQIEQYKIQSNNIKQQLKTGGEYESYTTSTGGQASRFKAYSQTKLQQLQDDLKQTGTMLKGAQEQLNTLSGQTLDQWIENTKTANQQATAARENFNKMSKTQLNAWLKDQKNAADKHRAIAREVYEARFDDDTTNPGKTDPNKSKLDTLNAQQLQDQINAKNTIADKEKLDQKLLDIDIEYLTLKRNLYKKDSDEYNQYQNQLLDIDRNKKLEANTASIKILQDGNAARKAATDAYEKQKRDQLITDLTTADITQDQYTAQSLALDLAIAQRRLQDAQQYAELIREATYNTTADKEQATQAAQASLDAAADAITKANQAIAKQTLEAKQKTQKEAEEAEKTHLENIAKLRQELGLNNEIQTYQQGLDALKAKLKEAEASEKQTADAIKQYKIEKVNEYAQATATIVNGLGNAISASQQAQVDTLEAQKQKELSIAGTNATEREKIEKRYQQKELDLKKKQADATMGINIAKALADGALGIAEIWAKKGVNPVYAGILSAILAGITASNIKIAVQQRNAIKNTTLSGLEEGGHLDVTRAQDGKRYRNALYNPRKRGYIDRPTVIVGDGPQGKSKEWVASNAAIANPTIAPIIDILDKHQQAGTIRTLDMNQAIRANMAGLSTGGYLSGTPPTPIIPTPINTSTPANKTNKVLEELNTTLKTIQENGITADVSLTDLERKQNLRDRSRKIGSKK